MKRSLTSKVLGAVGLGNPDIALVRTLQKLKRRLARTDAQIAQRYFAAHAEPKFHIGGGPRMLDGWLNADLSAPPGVLQMDATQPFPFEDRTFKFLFTEHMIEHVPYDGGLAMLRECHRVLQDGGAIRVVTPDLASLAALCGPERSDLQTRYLKWFSDACVPPVASATAAAVLNAHFRLWGHEFLYDEETLAGLLRQAGFRDIRRYALMESPHSAFQNLENVERYPEGFLELESLALEARK